MMNIEEQVEYLMQGSDYGDATIAENMAKELHARLVNPRKRANLYVFMATIHINRFTSWPYCNHAQITSISRTGTSCHVVIIITAMIGDPDKDKLRSQLSLESMETATYAEQAFRILDPEKTEIVYNYEWLSKLT